MQFADEYGDLALTFDDVLLAPGYSDVLPATTDLRTRLIGDIHLSIPVISAAMDTVTEAPLAIALARLGGIGVIHRNLTPEEQAEEVDKVKRSESGMIVDPLTLRPDDTLAAAEALMSRYHISGIPITDDNGRLVGILTNRDTRFVEPGPQPIADFMTSDSLITAPVGTSLEEAKAILHRHRIEKLPLVDREGRLKGLITVKDILKKIDYPAGAVDERGRLLCAAALGVGDKALERLDCLVEAGVDVAAIDTAHGHTRAVLDTIRAARRRHPRLPIMAGNVIDGAGARALVEAGAGAIKVGIGAGSICTTRIVAGAGVPQISAIAAVAATARELGAPVIADGGIKYSGDIVKAITAGAEVVMLGSLLAGLDEAPGDVVLYEGRRYKEYRGMGSLGAMQGLAKDRYGTGQGKGSGKLVPEGVEALVAYKGQLRDAVYQMVGGLRSGMGYVGAKDIEALRRDARFIRISMAGLVESHPHDVTITKEAPNYERR